MNEKIRELLRQHKASKIAKHDANLEQSSSSESTGKKIVQQSVSAPGRSQSNLCNRTGTSIGNSELDPKPNKQSKSLSSTNSSSEVVQEIMFKCPFIGPGLLPKHEWEQKIKEHLYQNLSRDRPLYSCYIIHCLNDEKASKECVEVLCKYLSNLINSNDEKYRTIKMSNEIFQDKVVIVEGALEFLLTAGFRMKQSKINNKDEELLTYDSPRNIKRLKILVSLLRTTKPIPIILDRNTTVFDINEAFIEDVSSDYLNLTVDELREEQHKRTTALDQSLQLRTKAMRDRDQNFGRKDTKVYKYSLIRIRFPDSLVLQGTFEVKEKFIAVKNFVTENLRSPLSFELKTELGKTLTSIDNEKTLTELKLVPAVLLTFKWSSHISQKPTSFLNDECMKNVRTR